MLRISSMWRIRQIKFQKQLQIIKFAETIALYNIFPGLASGLYSKRRGGYNVEYIWKENGSVQSF